MVNTNGELWFKEGRKSNRTIRNGAPYGILWKTIFDESHMYGLEEDISYLLRSTVQYGVK
jgi:hypothetical protein